jgi:hypothetical protein
MERPRPGRNALSLSRNRSTPARPHRGPPAAWLHNEHDPQNLLCRHVRLRSADRRGAMWACGAMSGHDRVKLLCTEEAIDGCSEQRQVVTADGCVAVVIETSARCFALEQGPLKGIDRSGTGPRAREALQRFAEPRLSEKCLGHGPFGPLVATQCLRHQQDEQQ